MKRLIRPDSFPEIIFACIYDKESLEAIFAASKSTRDLVKDIVRVKSSNIWRYNMNIDKRIGDNSYKVS